MKKYGGIFRVWLYRLEFGIEACERTDSDMLTFVARWVFVAAESMMVVETIKWVHASTHFTGLLHPQYTGWQHPTNRWQHPLRGAGIHH